MLSCSQVFLRASPTSNAQSFVLDDVTCSFFVGVPPSSVPDVRTSAPALLRFYFVFDLHLTGTVLSQDKPPQPRASIDLFASSSFDQPAPAVVTQEQQVFVQVASRELQDGVGLHVNSCWLEGAMTSQARLTILENK